MQKLGFQNGVIMSGFCKSGHICVANCFIIILWEILDSIITHYIRILVAEAIRK